jgi:hypothetical protein
MVWRIVFRRARRNPSRNKAVAVLRFRGRYETRRLRGSVIRPFLPLDSPPLRLIGFVGIVDGPDTKLLDYLRFDRGLG